MRRNLGYILGAGLTFGGTLFREGVDGVKFVLFGAVVLMVAGVEDIVSAIRERKS